MKKVEFDAFATMRARRPSDFGGAIDHFADYEAPGFANARIRYRVFLPPRMKAIAGIERALSWLPLGAQHHVVAEKRASQ